VTPIVKANTENVAIRQLHKPRYAALRIKLRVNCLFPVLSLIFQPDLAWFMITAFVSHFEG
jgi:hypothetical protein